MARGPLAGAAGPGKFSKRTDGMRLPSAAYGEGVETAAIQSGAPLAKTPDVRPQSRSEMGMAPSQLERVTPLFAPTERPDEPITAGIARGEGPGPSAIAMQPPTQKFSDTLVKLLPFDDTGEIAILYQEALSRGN
jgi:hypothetical protein